MRTLLYKITAILFLIPLLLSSCSPIADCNHSFTYEGTIKCFRWRNNDSLIIRFENLGDVIFKISKPGFEDSVLVSMDGSYTVTGSFESACESDENIFSETDSLAYEVKMGNHILKSGKFRILDLKKEYVAEEIHTTLHFPLIDATEIKYDAKSLETLLQWTQMKKGLPIDNISFDFTAHKIKNFDDRFEVRASLYNSNNDTIYFLSWTCNGVESFLEYDTTRFLNSPLVVCNASYWAIEKIAPHSRYDFKGHFLWKKKEKAIKLGFDLYRVENWMDLHSLPTGRAFPAGRKKTILWAGERKIQ